MQVVLIVILVLAALIAGVLVFAATKPPALHVRRSTLVNAPPQVIFPMIEDFHRWRDWSPYENLDPDLKRDYSGAAKGKGAVYHWVGSPKVGEGRMEIVEVEDPGRVLIKLDFIKPFEAHNMAEFTMQPEGQATRVTWAMNGPNKFVSKLMSVFFDMDKAIGGSFEAGLANLKAAAERRGGEVDR